MFAIRITLILAALALHGCAFAAATSDGRHGVVATKEQGIQIQ